MTFERWKKDEFNGYLHSLRYICDKHGTGFFALDNDCALNRVECLNNSVLDNSSYVASILWTEDFEDSFQRMKEDTKGAYGRKQKSQDNRDILYLQLKEARKSFCQIGTRKVKILLNSLAEFEISATILRLLLEIEDVNINAKNSYKDYAKYKYYEKENLIEELVDLFNSKNYSYGYKLSDIPTMKYIVFFDFCEKQFSWHTNLEINVDKIYKKDWDKLENSNLLKIENLILQSYSDEINQLKF